MPCCSRLAASEVAHRFGRSITSPWGSKPGLHVGRSGGPEAGVEPRGRGEGRQNHAARCDRTRPPKTKWRPPGIEPGLPAWGKACGYGCRLVAGRSLPRPAVALPTSIQASGYIAQWLERLTADQQVPGSNPGVPFCIAPAKLVRLKWVWRSVVLVAWCSHDVATAWGGDSCDRDPVLSCKNRTKQLGGRHGCEEL